MAWFITLSLAAGGIMLRNLFSKVASSNSVLEVKLDVYSNSKICSREDAMVLYETEDKSRRYQIVLHRPCTESLNKVYSLLRTDKYEEAQTRFMQLKGKLEMILKIAKDFYNVNGIQRICDTIRENPTWNCAHIVAHLKLIECFQNEQIINLLNDPDEATGVTPLHVAVKTADLQCIQAVIAVNGSLEPVDHKGNSVFHFAAVTTKEIINVLSNVSIKSLNVPNYEGFTPLHIACRFNSLECVVALLKAGADANVCVNQISNPVTVAEFFQRCSKSRRLNIQDMNFGGTPLHWSRSREVIDSLIDMGCNMNIINFDNRTTLHIMVLMNSLECVIALLSRGINADIRDVDGNTALHLAVKEENLPIIKALIAFGADVFIKNNAGETPRHLSASNSKGKEMLHVLHAVGASRCLAVMKNCGPGCSADGNGSGDVTSSSSYLSRTTRDLLDSVLANDSLHKTLDTVRGGRLLCLDGGGIRGLILVIMLLELENATGKPIIDSFDWIAGTSTGGILALALASGKTLRECLCMYFHMKEKAFNGGRPYSSEPLENLLKETFGKNKVMAEIKKTKIMVTAVLADRKPVELHLFRNYHSARDILKINKNKLFVVPPQPEEQLIWCAARATGAAPSYFSPFEYFLDGGLMANNPTLDAITEIHEYNSALKHTGKEEEVNPLTMVISLGTGLSPVSSLEGIDVFEPHSPWATARLAVGISSLAQLLVDQATCSNGSVVDRARSWCSMIGVPYYRFNPQLCEDIMMDEKDDEKLVNMLWEAKVYMYEKKDIIIKLANMLDV